MMTFPAIRIEGGLLGPDTVEQLLRGELPGQKPADFGLDGRRNLLDEIAAAFADCRKYWEAFQHRLGRLPEGDPATSVTRDAWAIPFFSLLGIEARYTPRAREVDGMSFPISHRMGEAEDAPPLHIVGARQGLDRAPASGRPRLSPHALMQEYLNRTEHLWGVVTNGLTLRLLRSSAFVRQQAYIEFDLRTMLEEQRFNDFAALYRLLHRTRFPRGVADAADCLLEQYYQLSIQQGGRVRERLREGVEEAIVRLANGFLSHPANDALRQKVAKGEGPLPAQDFYRQLLRLVYRFLFLLVAEERGLMNPNGAGGAAPDGAGAGGAPPDGTGDPAGGTGDPAGRPYNYYGVSRLRRLCERRAAYTDDTDLWHSLRALWAVLADEKMAAILGAPPLNGKLFAPLALDDALITNRDLLGAFWHLAFYQEGSAPPRPVNYAALDTEELGSVYESLLELHPVLETQGSRPNFRLETRGGERRTTGSHYTPPELVSPLIQHALEPVLQERLSRGRTRAEKEAAILGMKVLDPACGSGHFLLAAARRLGKELARVRTGEDEPAPARLREAIRDVIAHCIYGVDKNPLAVELARVALWLESHAPDRPLTFLDHHIRCGDSLVGLADLTALEAGIPDAAYQPLRPDQRTIATRVRKRNAIERAQPLFQHSYVTQPLERVAAALRDLDALPEDTLEQVHAKSAAYQRLMGGPAFDRLRLAADAWTVAFFQPLTPYPRPAAPDTPSPLSRHQERGEGVGGSEERAITTDAVWHALAGDPDDPQLLADAQALAAAQRFFHWALEFAEVFAAGGFDVILGNPPFMGGLKISGNFGEPYRKWLEFAYQPFGGTADLCAAFFRRAFGLLRSGGRLGLVATNTIGQGDTRESGLKVILAQGGRIPFAQRFVKWPGQASVEVNLVVLQKPPSAEAGGQPAPGVLDGHPVPAISSRLDADPEAEPVRLRQNEGKAFIGDYVRGIGFVLEAPEAERLLAKDPRHADCLFPYLNGEDLNSHPEQQPSRWVICFHDWSLERAKQYPDLLRIVEERVKPERERLTGPGDKRNREYWWQFGAYRAGMRQAIAPLQRVLVRSRVSELHMLAFVPKGYVYGDATVVFAFDDDYHFALLQSGVHEVWVWRQASSLESRNRYTPTDCFDTFPFPLLEYERMAKGGWQLEEMPEAFQQAAGIGAEYHEHRRQIMLARGVGLTKTYNLFHDPACQDAEVVRLRELHVEMDRAVLACYGWDDLAPGHGFHQNERGQTRFTVSPDARREILGRLVALNLEVKRERYDTI